MKHILIGAVAASALLSVAAQATPISGPAQPANAAASSTLRKADWYEHHRYWRHHHYWGDGYWHRHYWRHRYDWDRW